MVKKHFWTSKTAAVIIDAIVCVLITLGLVQPLFYARSLDAGWMAALGGALLAAALVTVLFLRWWIVPALALLSLLPGTWILSRLDRLQDWFRATVDWFSWAGQRLLLGGPEPTHEFWLSMLRLMIIFVITLPVYGLVHKLSRIYLLAIPILLVAIPFLIAHPSAIPQVLPALAGLIVLLPVSVVRTVRKKQPQAVIPRAPLQWLALPVAIISVLAGQLLTPADTRHWRQQDWINRMYDMRDFLQNQSGSTRGWQPFDLSIAGFRSSETQLGGPVRPSDRVFIDVTAPSSVLLRGVTRSIYTGSSWRSPPHQVFRLESALWRLIRRQVYNLDLPTGSDGRQFRETYAETMTVTLSPRTRLQTTIFTVERLETLSWDAGRDYPPYFTIDGDLFVFEGLPPNPSYTVTVTVWQRNRQGFAEAIRTLAESPLRSRDPYWAAIQDRYLQLPDTLPDVVAATARQVVGDETDPYNQALLLERYFRDQFDYALDPEFPPADMDFIEHLLLDQKGYCVHFATAMTVMARTLGLPARYVEGFALDTVSDTNRNWRATGRTAHAWSEIYLQGIGWLTFDPTPAERIDPPEQPVEPIDEPTPEPTAFIPLPSLTPVEPTEPEQGSYGWLILLIGLLALAMTVRLLILALVRNHLRNLRLPVMHRLEPDLAACMDLAYQDVLHQLARIDVKPEMGETLYAFAQRANHYLRFESVDLSELLWPVICLRYGRQQPTLKALDAVLTLRLRLEDRLRESLSGSAWFFQRVLPVYIHMKRRLKAKKRKQRSLG